MAGCSTVSRKLPGGGRLCSPLGDIPHGRKRLHFDLPNLLTLGIRQPQFCDDLGLAKRPRPLKL